MTVFCLVELDGDAAADASLRALTFARGLAAAGDGAGDGARDGLAAVVFGPVVADTVASGSQLAADLAAFGVADVYAVTGIEGYAPAAWAAVLAGLPSARAVVAAGTERGNEVLAHLGAVTGLPMAANCVAAEVSAAPDGRDAAGSDAGEWRLVRQRWAGLLLEEAVLSAPAALLTVAADVVAAVPAEVPGAAAIREITPHEIAPALDAGLVISAAETPAGGGGASLATARVVVGGGRGVGGAEGFAPLEELASLLGGVVGVSRVVTSEGWRPHSMQVGQTGTKITPELYLACGISGAIQHFAGCSGAKHIVAVNTDPAAPMVTRADYAVVGDLHEVVPALVKALRERAPAG